MQAGRRVNRSRARWLRGALEVTRMTDNIRPKLRNIQITPGEQYGQGFCQALDKHFTPSPDVNRKGTEENLEIGRKHGVEHSDPGSRSENDNEKHGVSERL